VEIRNFISTLKLSDCCISPDGKWIAYETQAANFELDDYERMIWLLCTETGEVRRITGPGQANNATWSPDGRSIAFISDRSGVNELYLIPIDGGEARQLSQDGGVGPLSWSPDGTRIAYVHTVPAETKPDSLDLDVWQRRPYVVTQRTYKIDGTGISIRAHPQIMVASVHAEGVEQITSGLMDSLEAAYSPDGKHLAIVRSRLGSMESHLTDLWLADADGSNARRLTDSVFNPKSPSWSPDGSVVAFYGSQDSDSIVQLWLYDLATNCLRIVVDGQAYEVASVAGYPAPRPSWSKDGSRLYFPAARHAHAVLASVDHASGRITELVSADGAVVFPSIAAAAGMMAYGVSSWSTPARIEVCDLSGAGGRELLKLEDDKAGQPASLHVEERCLCIAGEQRQAWLMRPSSETRAAPLLVDIHGGPYSFHANTFPRFALWYALVDCGWTVLLLNAVGSSSFGKKFAQRLRGSWGEADLPEHLAAVDQLVEEGIADPERLALYGYSYGGFAVSLALGTTHRFKAAIVGAPITNFVSYFATGDNAARFLEDDLRFSLARTDLAIEKSPVSRVRNCKTPTLIIQGLADDRCPPGQSEELFAHLLEAGVECELLLYPEASHKFTTAGKPSQRLDVEERMLAWLLEHCAEGP